MDSLHQQVPVTEKKTPAFMRVSIIIAIVIVLNLFSNYVVSLIFKQPAYEEFVKPMQVVEDIQNKDSCISTGGQWSENAYPAEKGKTKVEGYCNANYTNEINYNKAREAYEKKVFISLIVFGVFLLALAGFIGLQILAISFAWGGVLSLIIASVRYWSLADGISKVVILALALALLIWLAVKKFNK